MKLWIQKYFDRIIKKNQTGMQLNKPLRQKQLTELLNAINALLAYLPQAPLYQGAEQNLHGYRILVEKILEEDFDQEVISQLSRTISPLIYTHKEWMPPLIETENGTFEEPPWFHEFEHLHTSMIQLAFSLRVIGET